MGTDPEPSMRNKADQQLVEIDKKYAGFIHVSNSNLIFSKYCSVLLSSVLIPEYASAAEKEYKGTNKQQL